jgi:signal transduction histidine kinase
MVGRMGPGALGGFAAVILAGTVATYWVAGAALRPLRATARSAAAIDMHSLDARLPLSRPHDEIRDLSASFNSVLDRLEEGIEHERRFISDASHELRTPLAVMRTNLEVVWANANGDLADYRRTLRALDHSVNRLERLVEDLLLLATNRSIGATEIVRLPVLLEEATSPLQAEARERGITITIEPGYPIEVLGSEVLLHRVVSNLLDNAIAYNRDGGWVRVSAHPEGNWVAIEVADSGIGIRPEHRERIFERLWRGDVSRSRASGGAGLGLALVSEIVERHGGQVYIESDVGLGSTFTVRLPRVVGGSDEKI